MANFIRPDPAPLPPTITSAAAVVTEAGGTPSGVMPQPPVTTSSTPTPVVTITVIATRAVTLVTTIAATVVTTADPPVTATMVSMVAGDAVRVSNVGTDIPNNLTPQGGMVLSSQPSLVPVVEATGTTPTVAVGGTLVTPQTSSGVAIFPAFSLLSGTSSSASQGQSTVSTSLTPAGSNHPVSHPIIIQPPSSRPLTSVMMGVKGLTLPSDPRAMVTAMVARLVEPTGSQTSLHGLASH